jgi:hypothetical protein
MFIERLVQHKERTAQHYLTGKDVKVVTRKEEEKWVEIYRVIKSLCVPDDYNTGNTIITTHVFLASLLGSV